MAENITGKELREVLTGGKEVFLKKTGLGGLLKAWSAAKWEDGSWFVPCIFLDGDKVILQRIKLSENSPMAKKLTTEGVFRGH